MNTGTKKISLFVVTCGLAMGVATSAFADAAAAEKHFKAMDTDSDGKISRTEHAAGAKQMFAKSDANKDGAVTVAELDAAMAAQGGTLAKDEMSSAEKIQTIDQNNDGKLTAAEHEAGSEKMFGKMDANSDGFLSKEECDAGQKLMKKPNPTS